MDSTIKSTVVRTRQYWYIDGFNEMLVGLVFMLLGAINFIGGLYAPSMGSAVLVGIGYPLVMLAWIFAGRVWVRSLKEKITYPRTGYVKYIQPQRSSRVKRMVTASFVAIAVSIITMVVIRGLDPFWVVLGTGLMIAAFIGYLAVQVPLNRFFVLAIWVAAVSIASAFIPVSENLQMGFLLTGSGLGWLVSGVLTLLSYLKNTRPTEPGMEEI